MIWSPSGIATETNNTLQMRVDTMSAHGPFLRAVIGFIDRLRDGTSTGSSAVLSAAIDHESTRALLVVQ